MEKKVETIKMKRQRKFLMVLPLIALPFLTFMFWSLGGGKMEAASAQAIKPTGLNSKLPDANLKAPKAMDKMSYYDQARLDSLKFEELVRNDPNYKNQVSDSSVGGIYGSAFQTSRGNGLNTSLYTGGSNDPNSEMIYRKLAQLDKEMKNPSALPNGSGYYGQSALSQGAQMPNGKDASIKQLEQMMATMGQSGEEDPEMKQLTGMLEKILDIQHPDRVQEKLKSSADAKRGQVYAVSTKKKEDKASLLEPTVNYSANGFYSIDDNASEEEHNAIRAVIHGSQTLVNGSTVKLRLTDDIVINGVQIPKDNFLFGLASIKGERLSIEINSVRYQNSIFPVELTVYDLDGLDGIYIPGAISRDVAKQSADRSMQSIGLSSMDPSWGAQAADAGIEAAKSLISKKVKLIKVNVKAGYQVLLRDEKQKQNQSN